MSNKEDIRNEGLADKLTGFTPEPPEAVWEGISSKIQPKKARKGLFIWFLAAAGVLLTLSVGVKFLFPEVEGELALEQKILQEEELISSTEETQTAVIMQSDGNIQSDEKVHSQELVISEETVKFKKTILDEENIPTSNDDIVAPKLAMQSSTVVAEDSQSHSGKEKQTRIEKQVLEVLEEIQLAEHIEGAEKDSAGFAENTIQSDSLLIEDMSEEELIAALVPPLVLVEDEAKKKGAWQFGAALAPQYSYRDVASPDLMQNAIVNSAESGKITYAGGFNVSYLPNDKLTFESGVFYNKMGVNIGDFSVFGFLENWKDSWNSNDFVDITANVGGDRGGQFVNVSNSMGTVMSSDNSLIAANYGSSEVVDNVSMMNSGDLFVEGERVDYLSQSLAYLEIPFNLKYKIYDKDFVVQIIGGLSTNFLIGNKLDAVTPNNQLNIGSVANVKTVNYSGNAGIGVLYDLFDNFTLCVEPRFRYYLNSVNTDYLPATRPYALGFYTGVSYSF